MDIVIIFNGLGNQMSQYAFYLAKRERNPKCKVFFSPLSLEEHNGSELDKIFKIKYENNWIIKLLKRIYTLKKRPKIWKIISLFGIRIIKEPSNYDFDEVYLKKGPWGINFYWGGWHSEKYYFSVKETILHQYIFPQENDKTYLYWYNKILNDTNSVSLHVRRGDYINIKSDDFYQFNGVATLEFYNKAIKYILMKNKNASFYIFSNDIEWCKKEFGMINTYFIECNKHQNSWRDMQLMSICRNHINANSTFSWWGAWLDKNKDAITIVPDRFIRTIVTKDFYPSHWIKL